MLEPVPASRRDTAGSERHHVPRPPAGRPTRELGGRSSPCACLTPVSPPLQARVQVLPSALWIGRNCPESTLSAVLTGWGRQS